MDRFEGGAWLDWWANELTCLVSFEVEVRIAAVDAGWQAEGQLRREEDREGLEFFCDFDPVFVLRIGEDSTIEVSVTPSLESIVFTLAEYADSEPGQLVTSHPTTPHQLVLVDRST